MRLNAFVNKIETLGCYGNLDREVVGIAYDSRKVEEGFVFVCIKGFKVDGHDYAKQAVEKGAHVLIVEHIDQELKNLQEASDITMVHVADGRQLLGELSKHYYKDPSSQFKMIGITGTNGKTSIAQMLTHSLEKLAHKCAVLGTIENRIGKEVYPSDVTTPESLELNQLFAEMINANVDYCTMEVSSHALELKRVEGIQFDYGIFTNLTKDHLNFHGTMEAYFESKALLFNKTNKANVINIDDPYGKKLKEREASFLAPVITYGLDQVADITAKNIKYTAMGSEFTLVTPQWELEVSIPIPGKIYVYNCLAAVGVLFSEAFTKEDVKKGIDGIQPIPGRLEPIMNKTGINVVVDFAHTPDSLENVIKVARAFTQGKLITVFGCGGNRDKSKRPEMGKIATELSDYTYVTSDNPRHEEPQLIIKDILDGISADHEKYGSIVDRKEAIEAAIKKANPMDTVLIAGKGHETYQIIGDVKNHFDDREIARKILEA